VNTPFFISDVDTGLGRHAGRVTVGRKATRVEDYEIRFAELRQFFWRRSNQHRVHEERVIGTRADHTNLHLVFRIPTGKRIHNVQVVASVQVVNRPLAVDLKDVVIDVDVDWAPPDIIL